MQAPARTRRTPRRRRPILIATLAAAAVSLAACSSGGTGTAEGGEDDGSSGGTTAVTVGVIPIVDVAPIYLGVQEGIFDKHGLDVTLESAQGGAAIVPAVVSGQYQFGFSNTTSLLLAASNGLELQAVAEGVSSTGEEGADFGAVVAPADSGIASAKDLEGKTVAVNTLNNINTTTVNKAVEADGGDPSTITYTELAFPDIVAAVQKGDVDAGQVVEPFLTQAAGQGLEQVVSNYAVTDPDLTVAMYFTSNAFAQQDPDTVQAFTDAMAESLAYAQDNPDAVREVLTTYTEIDEATLKDLTLPRWPAEIDTDSVQLLADLAVADGLMPEAPDLSTLLP
ncbi:ABC transporter substrate-binding protein [Isoptericola sp. NPDC056618]|uniref:ABC transporter substrate-binding protein n=1 Tax=Isoptericola sp. NPDC056618 TaxID=3345878 RepID=UPI0036D14873